MTPDAPDDLIALLEELRSEAVEPHVALLPIEAMRRYLRTNVARVMRLVERLRRLLRGSRRGPTQSPS